jgi:hypothetical protein
VGDLNEDCCSGVRWISSVIVDQAAGQCNYVLLCVYISFNHFIHLRPDRLP